MTNLRFLGIIVLQILFVCCSSKKALVDKIDTHYGKVKFYNESKKNNIQHIYASVDSSGFRSYYEFYPNKITKTSEVSKQMIYTVFDGDLPKDYDKNIYLKFSPLDKLILNHGNRILDSLGLKNFKRTNNENAFIIEVNYYHGYPKNKSFKR